MTAAGPWTSCATGYASPCPPPSSLTTLANSSLPSPANRKPSTPRPSKLEQQPQQQLEEAEDLDGPALAQLRSDILQTLVAIDRHASQHPDRRVAIRNRTRESVTRQLYYERDAARLYRLQRDALKLLQLWSYS